MRTVSVVLRSALFNVWFFIMTFGLVSWGVLLRRWAPDYVPGLARLWARLGLAGARVLCGLQVAVTGQEHLPPGPALVASQHQSAFDTMIWLRILPRASYVVKAELERLPLFGPLLRPGRQVLVDRAAGAAAIRRLVTDAAQVARIGYTLVIFPEGTRVAPGEQVRLLPGIAALAARSGLPVMPAATDSGVLWGRRAFRKYPGTIHVAIGPPLPPGLPRPALLEGIERAWHDLATGWPKEAGGAVDNSVQ